MEGKIIIEAMTIEDLLIRITAIIDERLGHTGNDEEMMTPVQVRKELGKTRQTLYNWHKSGILKYTGRGHGRKYKRSEVLVMKKDTDL